MEQLYQTFSSCVCFVYFIWKDERGITLLEIMLILWDGIYVHIYIYIYIKLLYFIFNYFFGYAMQHVESLLPWPGIKPMPLAVEAWSLNPWTTREVHLMEYVFIYKSLVLLSKHSISLVVLVIFLSDSVHQFNQYLCFFFFFNQYLLNIMLGTVGNGRWLT